MAAPMAKNNPQRSRSLNICKPLFKARLAMVIAPGGHGGAVADYALPAYVGETTRTNACIELYVPAQPDATGKI
jgi:hypothetical protein